MKLSQKLCGAVAALLCSGTALAGGEGWTSDFAAAQKTAEASKQDMILDFTGSDWCGFCIKLNEEVFQKDVFKAAVKDKFVLVEVDFPQDESKISAATKKQNEELADKYPIDGYPTLVLTDAKGLPYAFTGYEEGGAEPYVKHLEELRGRKVKRDEAFAAAEKAEGAEKAKSLMAGLTAMALPAPVEKKFYSEVIAKLKAADPQDTTGYAKKEAARERFAKFEAGLDSLGETEDITGALTLTEKTIAEGGLDPEDMQKVVLTKASILANQGKFDDALKTVEEARKVAPTSEIAGHLDEFKGQLEEAKKDAAAAPKEDAAPKDAAAPMKDAE